MTRQHFLLTIENQSHLLSSHVRVYSFPCRHWNAPSQAAGQGQEFRLRHSLTNLYAQYVVPAYGLERVDILRGPSSVMYGAGNLGGIVNMVSKQPVATPFLELQFQYGSYNYFAEDVDFGGPIDPEKHWLYLVTNVFSTADSQIDYVHPHDIYVAPALTWAPSSATYITFLSSFYHQETKASPSYLPQRGTLLSNPNGSIPTSFYSGEPTFDKFDRTEYSVGYEFHQELGDSWKLEQNFRYSYLSIEYRDVTGFDFEPLSNDILSRIYLTTHGYTNDIRVDTHLEGRFNTGPLEHDLLLGFDYQFEDLHSLVLLE